MHKTSRVSCVKPGTAHLHTILAFSECFLYPRTQNLGIVTGPWHMPNLRVLKFAQHSEDFVRDTILRQWVIRSRRFEATKREMLSVIPQKNEILIS